MKARVENAADVHATEAAIATTGDSPGRAPNETAATKRPIADPARSRLRKFLERIGRGYRSEIRDAAKLASVDESTLKSSLLVAMPQLQDPNFKRTVVLLIHHSEEGTFGLVLNRPYDLSVSELCESIECRWSGEADQTVYCGGPVQGNTGWVLFDRKGLALEGVLDDDALDEVTDVGEGLSFAGSIDVLRAVAEAPPRDTRLFLGYAGWGPGQLESELAQNAWLVAPFSLDAIFGVDDDSMWDYVVRGLGIDPATLVTTRGVH